MKSPDQTRQELLHALSQLSCVRPDLRLGQMMANLATVAGRMDSGAAWDLEDEEALAVARNLLNQAALDETEPHVAERPV